MIGLFLRFVKIYDDGNANRGHRHAQRCGEMLREGSMHRGSRPPPHRHGTRGEMLDETE